MKYLALVFAILLTACGNNKDAAKGSQESINVTVSSFTAQSSFPGVESNLRSTKIYKCDILVSTDTPFEIIELLVDSVKLPVQSLNLNGDVMKNESAIISGDSTQVIFQANRKFFNAEAKNQIFEVEEYEISRILVPDMHALLNVRVGGQVKSIDLGEFEKKASVFHP